MFRQKFRVTWVLASVLSCCAAPRVSAGAVSVAVIIRADRAWTDTGVEIASGSALHIDADGTIRVLGMHAWDWLLGSPVQRSVGPSGTYVWPRLYQPRRAADGTAFPLPAMADGPSPAFCLIGKIGDGAPFYVGARYDGVVHASGRLWLGVNDDRLEDNRGEFRVRIDQPAQAAREAAGPPVIAPGSRRGQPIPDARVILIYVDGLRLDVLRDMARGGFLPNIARAFLDHGVVASNAFTVFPSNTLIANGALFTGCFSDRTGIKSQNQFERATLKMRGQLSAYLPDGFMAKPATRVINLLDKYAPENTHTFLAKRGIATLATRLGRAYAYTTLPIIPLNPPPQWVHRAVNTLGPFGLPTRLPMQLDDVNAEYAVEDLLGDSEARVIAIWFPMVDKHSHHSGRGQFGAARRDLALADRALGRILERLRELRWDRSTYLLLVSDHGHLGGETTVNRACNLPRDWAHQQLGCNAKVVGQEWIHPGIDARRFLFFDNQGAGQAKLFLPYGSYFSGPWRRNRLFELTHYRLRPGQVVNLVESLTRFHPPAWDGRGPSPVDLVLIKLDERRVLVYRDEERQAIISSDLETSGREVYRYEPISHLSQTEDGAFHQDPPPPGQDPLGYLQDPAFLASIGTRDWLTVPHTAREWLLATSQTRYPDAVVAMATFFAWHNPVKDLADARDPDLLVSASAGWSFRSDDDEGTDHGYPLADSMRMTLVLAGPNITSGELRSPQRIVNVLPTMLDMIHWPYDPAEMDGQAITGIYD